MRTSLLALLAVAAAGSSARADDSIAGVYDIKIDEMADNCSPVPITLVNKSIKLGFRSGALEVNLETIPVMTGSASKTGRISAKTPKVAPTTFRGLDGKYSIAGRVAPDRSLELVLVAEYSNSATKKAYCTQSWTITGKHGAGAPAPTK